MAPPSIHDADSESGVRDHDDCVAYKEFRALSKIVEKMADDLAAVKGALMISTPDRGCVIDTQRKHDSQIKDLQDARSSSFPRRILETAVLTATSTITVLAIAMLGKGIVVSIVTEALKLAGGTK